MVSPAPPLVKCFRAKVVCGRRRLGEPHGRRRCSHRCDQGVPTYPPPPLVVGAARSNLVCGPKGDSSRRGELWGISNLMCFSGESKLLSLRKEHGVDLPPLVAQEVRACDQRGARRNCCCLFAAKRSAYDNTLKEQHKTMIMSKMRSMCVFVASHGCRSVCMSWAFP